MPALLVSLGLALGCQARNKPEPKKVERATPFDRHKPRTEREPDDPVRNPEFEVPAGRDGEQVDDAAIDAALAEAAEAMRVGNPVGARSALRACANKTPASARCDGEFGLTMTANKRRRTTATYYLAEAANNDDPKADANLYLRVGMALRGRGEIEAAVLALDKVVARDDSAENMFLLGQTMSIRPETITDGVEWIAKARAKDDRDEWLYEEAVLRGQVPIREHAQQAAKLLTEYIERTKDAPKDRKADEATLKLRIAELEGAAKSYPLAKDYAAAKAEADAAANSTGGAKGEAPTEAPVEDPATSDTSAAQ